MKREFLVALSMSICLIKASDFFNYLLLLEIVQA